MTGAVDPAELPAILAEDFRQLLEIPGRVVIDLVSLVDRVVPVVRFAEAGRSPRMLGVILDGGAVLSGNDTSMALARLHLLAGRLGAVELIGNDVSALGARH